MFKYEKPQALFNIGGVKLGGQPGEWPTVMCGSIFYGGHKIVSDAAEGIFDKAAARELLNLEGKLTADFGLQRIPDVVGDTSRALTKYVEFVLESVEGALLVDSASIKTLIETFEHFKGSAVMDRLIYSPVDMHTEPEHFEAITRLGVKNALLLAFSPTAVMPEQKFELLLGKGWKNALDSGTDGDGLLFRAKQAGIENLMVDVGAIDLQGTAWSAMAITEVNRKLGLPTGCAPANALFSWQRVHKDMITGAQQTAAVGAAVYTSTIYSGANFVLYGPMRCCEWAYPACAAADSLVAYGNRLNGVKPKEKSHPLFKLK
jgi:tetrahydromethanopterin S-methyltransferase subunit H